MMRKAGETLPLKLSILSGLVMETLINSANGMKYEAYGTQQPGLSKDRLESEYRATKYSFS